MAATSPLSVADVPPEITRDFARLAVKLHWSDVPQAVRERAKLHILDAIGLGFAAHAHDFAAAAIAGVSAMAEPGGCAIIGRPERMPPRDAALVNAILMHGLDYDDTHLGSIIHPTCTSLPVALALGEARDARGDEMLAAFLVGAEFGIRIGAAVQGGFHHVGYHATGVVSHFASAVTAGRLLGLDEAQIVAAQGITGSTASGVQVFLEEGAWTKRFHPGWGAVGGITAAYLARADFRGPSRPFEGKFGLFDTHLHGQAAALDALTDGLGDTWRFGETALKPYPVCHFIHGCADAAIELHQEIAGAGIALAQIESVEALLPQPTLHIVAEPAAAKERPNTDYEAKFSAQFVVAACLLKGGFGLSDLRPEAIADPVVRDLALRVVCRADPDSAFPTFFSGGVSVRLKDGRTFLRHVRVNSGAGDRAMTPDAVVAKFMDSATLSIEAARAERIRDAVLSLETIYAKDLADLLRAMPAA